MLVLRVVVVVVVVVVTPKKEDPLGVKSAHRFQEDVHEKAKEGGSSMRRSMARRERHLPPAAGVCQVRCRGLLVNI